MSNRERVLIFGFGYHGRAVYRLLDRKLYDIVGFIENSDLFLLSSSIGEWVHASYPGAIGGKFDDTNIYHINNINHIDFDKVVISGPWIDEMIRQLKDEFFIDRKKILVLERSDLTLKGIALEKKEEKICEMFHYFNNLFIKEGIDYWVSFSSLLALKRGEEFAKFADVDVFVMSEKIPFIYDLLKKDSGLYDITTNRYQNSTKYWEKGDLSTVSISERVNIVISEPAGIDFMALNKYHDRVFSQGPSGTMHIFPFSYFDGNSKISRFNIDIPVPLNTEEYLRIVYGENWKTPDERWQVKNYKSVKTINQ